ncbi:MAG: hypothetical protein B7Z08_01560 [Sphingomonadales bacterium 32-68-7]|nr:MAG: hypothetical protein B7Z33_00400 [Sphingomonadales bacterium 12-68-11]OYX10266.1 MAG: hypothetical protein B7Z08_01560 [Sphingomonadales bacterium 32-68-7]
MAVRLRALVLAGFAVAAAAAAPASARADDPLPRVEGALCPGIAGFDTQSALQMVDRIRANVSALGLRLANPDTCKPNVLVAVVEDGNRVLRAMARESPHMFAALNPSELRALVSQEGPARVYAQVVTRTRDGQPVPIRNNLTDVPQASGWMAHSKIYTATRQDIVHVLILLDRDGIADKSVGQIADYVTVRALVPVEADEAAGSDESILGLFDGGAGPRPDGLTGVDHALLSTLYDGIPNLPARGRLADLDTQATRRAAAK